MPKFKTNENNITVILRMKSYSLTIHMKATEQSVIYCGVMSIMLYKVVLTSDPMV